MSAIDASPSNNGRAPEAWSQSWTHLRIDRRTPGYCRVTFDHPPINTITAMTVAELVELVGLIEQDPRVYIPGQSQAVSVSAGGLRARVVAYWFFLPAGDWGLALEGSGLAAARAEPPPDAVLLDIAMPGALDGAQTLRAIKAHSPSLPVIMVTANSDLSLAQGTLRDGALDYLMKPVEIARLREVLMAAMAVSGKAAPPE